MIKSKECNAEGCKYPRWAKGFCKYHQNLRTDSKKPKPLSRQPIKNKPKQSGELVMFFTIWNTRERVSFLSGKPLSYLQDTQFWVNIFAHVLSKAQNRYPKFKLYESNIILLTPDEHYLLDFGSEDQREAYAKENGCDWNKIYELKEKLKNEYREQYG